MNSLTESAFSKVIELYYKWNWRNLLQSLFFASVSDISILCHYTNDNTLYTFGKDSSTVDSKWKLDSKKFRNFKRFYKSFIVLHPDISYFLVFGFQNAQPIFYHDNIKIKNVSEEKTLGIAINYKLTFKYHLKNICKKANQKLIELFRMMNFTSVFERKNSFIKSQFLYCPLIWMFSPKRLDK